MKSTVLLPLALAILLLGQERDSQGQAGPARRADDASLLETVAPAEPTAASTVIGVRTGPPSDSPAGAAQAEDRSRAMAPSQPTGAHAELTASLPIIAPDSQDWRDSALDLLSQIGVLCPASGCDSLEDD